MSSFGAAPGFAAKAPLPRTRGRARSWRRHTRGTVRLGARGLLDHTLRPAPELPNVPIADNFGPGAGGCESRMSHLDASLWTRIDLQIRSKMAWSHPSVPLVEVVQLCMQCWRGDVGLLLVGLVRGATRTLGKARDEPATDAPPTGCDRGVCVYDGTVRGQLLVVCVLVCLLRSRDLLPTGDRAAGYPEQCAQ